MVLLPCCEQELNGARRALTEASKTPSQISDSSWKVPQTLSVMAKLRMEQSVRFDHLS